MMSKQTSRVELIQSNGVVPPVAGHIRSQAQLTRMWIDPH